MMKKVVVAFDVDGTLRCNAEERHRNEVEANVRIVEFWTILSSFKNIELHIWSNRGADYCREIAKQFGLKKVKGYHKKQWHEQSCAELMEGGKPFMPDIAIDDQQRFDGGLLANLIVREK